MATDEGENTEPDQALQEALEVISTDFVWVKYDPEKGIELDWTDSISPWEALGMLRTSSAALEAWLAVSTACTAEGMQEVISELGIGLLGSFTPEDEEGEEDE